MRTFPCRNYKAAKGDVVLIPGWQPIPEDKITLAEIFRHKGYVTGLFASTHHMFKPSMNFHRGYTCWEFIRGQEADHFKRPLEGDVTNLDNLPCEEMYGIVGHSLPYCLANVKDWREESDWFAPRTFGAAAKWLEENSDDSFFLAIDEFDPHEPWNPPLRYLEQYLDVDSYNGRRIIPTVGGPNSFKQGELEYVLASYAGEVTHCDHYVGVLFDKIKSLGHWDNTVIALVSDHGHNIMDHGVMHKIPDHMYRELMDLVYIIKSPEKDYFGVECDAYVAHHDIPVTLMEMAGIVPPEGLDGRNVWKWVTGDAPQTRDYATCIFYPWLWTRDSQYVYMTDNEKKMEKLYDLEADPFEKYDISNEHPDICKRLRQRIWNEAGGDPPIYDVIRQGHEWYEYPDIHDPRGTFSESLKRQRDERVKK